MDVSLGGEQLDRHTGIAWYLTVGIAARRVRAYGTRGRHCRTRDTHSRLGAASQPDHLQCGGEPVRVGRLTRRMRLRHQNLAHVEAESEAANRLESEPSRGILRRAPVEVSRNWHVVI